jgi:thiamine transporter ThiT
MIYAFVLAKNREKSTVLLFWDMLLKLCNIPIYLLIFFIGTFIGASSGLVVTILPFSLAIVFILMIFDYLLLLPSSMYGVSGLIQARREGHITTVALVVNCILHFLFCLDVISAIIMFCVVRLKSKNVYKTGRNTQGC